MFNDYPDIVGINDLQEMLDIGQVLAYRLVKKGEIKAKKIGRDYKIPKINVIKYVLGEMDKQ